MATLTVALEPEILEIAQSEAQRRNLSIDQLVAELIEQHIPDRERARTEILRMLNEGILGDIGRPLTRDEVYAERTWPRS